MYNNIYCNTKPDSNLEFLEVPNKTPFVYTENMKVFRVIALINKISHFLLPVQLHINSKLCHGSHGFPLLKI